MKNKRYYVLIFLSCCFLQGGSLGVLLGTAGQFYAPVCLDMGFTMAAFTTHRTIFGLASCITTALTGRLMEKYNVRVLLTAAALMCGLPQIGFSFCTGLAGWYALSAIQGLGAGAITVVAPTLILRWWFVKKTGTVISLAAVVSSIVAVLSSAATGRIISGFGWAAAYRLTGLASLMVLLPFTMFVIHATPASIGVKAYGEDECSDAAAGPRAVQIQPTTSAGAGFAVVMIILCSVALNTASKYSSFMSALGHSIGMDVGTAAWMSTISLAGSMVVKPLLGIFVDRFGVRATGVLGIGCTAAGLLLLLNPSAVSALAGSCLFGVSMPLTTILMPFVIRLAVDGDRFTAMFSLVTTIGTLAGSFGNSFFGWLYDLHGAFTLPTVVCLGLEALAIGSIFALSFRHLIFREPAQVGTGGD